MIQYRSTHSMSSRIIATTLSICMRRVTARCSSRRNGKAKWNTKSASATPPQVPLARTTYHGISSCKLPAQMMELIELKIGPEHRKDQHQVAVIIEPLGL